MHDRDWSALAAQIKEWGRELGFDDVGIAGTQLHGAENNLDDWLAEGCHGEMDYMASHGTKRARPEELMPGTRSIISVRIGYFPPSAHPIEVLQDGSRAYVSRHALGRDYHKLLKSRLQKLADRIAEEIGPFEHRAFTDSAPVMEKPVAEMAGLGWTGKNSLLIAPGVGSFFFLGEIFTDLPLPADEPIHDHCGRCRACVDACPTGAIVGRGIVDARRCISYLTIELKGSIPEELRPLMGNRIYGQTSWQSSQP